MLASQSACPLLIDSQSFTRLQHCPILDPVEDSWPLITVTYAGGNRALRRRTPHSGDELEVKYDGASIRTDIRGVGAGSLMSWLLLLIRANVRKSGTPAIFDLELPADRVPNELLA